MTRHEPANQSDLSRPADPTVRTSPTAAEPPSRPRRTRSARPSNAPPAGYTQSWALFTDWSAATDHQALPADPATVLDFLQACPAAAATQRRRLAAIDHHHAAASHPAPGDHDDVRAAVGRPPRERVWVCPNRAAVDTALSALPSHGFTAGLFGQRDRALLVLSQLVGLPYRSIAALTTSDLQHDQTTGTVTITSGGRARRVHPTLDAALCPACAITRWLRTHAVMTRYIATQPLINHLRAVEPANGAAAHDCRDPSPEPSAPVPLLPPVNQWGQVPFPQTQLSVHAVSRRTRDLLAADFHVHRNLDHAAGATEEPANGQRKKEPVPASVTAYRLTDRDAAWNRRRDDLRQLADVAADLDEVERQAAELSRRTAELVAFFAT